ncbi:prolipoprotein diacylglyceryl transferase [Actinomyces sp. oral taxon 414]|uniref:prolipoprotein diacylglyceryl transferase n=1 Tax=Actinomyces sp. oral taxon 414 TaxID=712122 RepID=UPI0009FB1131|nr:prolipoprotein diacylglyceryl transferase [Actinomyces sp. oral taxon 414]
MAPVSIPSPSRSVWYLGPFPLRAYALCILAGVFIAVWWTSRRYRARGGSEETVLDAAMLGVPVGILGARLYHVLTSPGAYFGPGGDPARIVQIWRGGLGIWGGVAAGIAATAWLMRRRGLRLAPLTDALAPALLVAQAVGRVGNWFNQELFGAPTTLPWGLEIDADHLPEGYAPGTLFHPTFLYEALWNLAGAALLVLLERRLRRRDGTVGGRLIWAYLMVYTAGRVWIEHLRVDEAAIVLGLRLNEWTAMIVFLAGLVGFIAAGRRGADDAIARPDPQSGPDPDAVDPDDAGSDDAGSDDEDRQATPEGPHGDTAGTPGDADRVQGGNG